MTTTWTVAVDWERNGNFTDTHDDITSYVINADWFLGMENAFRNTGDESRLQLLLKNDDGYFSPENTSSPLAGYLKPYRPIRVQADDGSTMRTLWIGWIDTIQPTVNRYGERTAELVAVGPLRMMKDAEANMPIQEQVRTDEVVQPLVLEAVIPPSTVDGWIIGRSRLGIDTALGRYEDLMDLEEGLVTLTMAADNWVRGGSGTNAERKNFHVYRAIEDVTAAERGRFFFQRDGKAVFWNREHLMLAKDAAAAFEDNMQGLEYNFANEADFRNEIVVTCHPRSISAGSSETLWELKNPISIAGGETRTLRAKFDDGAGNRVGGRQLSISYTFSQGDGQIKMNAKANTAELRITNTGTETAVLVSCTIKGQKIVDAGRMEATAEDGDSIAQYGRRAQKINLAALSDLDDAQEIAEFELERRKDPRGAVRSITLKSHGVQGGEHHANQLALTIGDRITVSETQTSHEEDYYIIGEAHKLTHGKSLYETQWYLEPVTTTYLAHMDRRFQDVDVKLQAKPLDSYGSDVTSTSTLISGGSYDASNTASNAFDNSSTSYASAVSGPTTHIGQDFGDGNEKNIRRVVLTRDSGTSGGTDGFNAKLQYSDNGTTWLDTDVTVDLAHDEGTVTVDVDNYCPHRYWRFKDLQGNANFEIDEIEMKEATFNTTGVNTKLAQSFQPRVSKPTDRIKLWLKKQCSPTGDLTVKLYTDSSEEPGSLIATSDTVSASDLSTEYQWAAFESFYSTIDTDTDSGDAGVIGNLGGTSYWTAQTFSPDNNGQFMRFSVELLADVGSPTGTITYQIREDDAGSPGNILVQSVFTPTASTVNSITLPSGVDVLSSDTYWIILKPTDAQSSGNYWQYARNTSGSIYTDGSGYSSDNGGSSWTDNNKDSQFSFDIEFSPSLSTGTTYWLVLDTTDSADGSNYVMWGAADTPYIENLISVWELEEESDTRYDSHGSNDLSDNNTVTSAPGKVDTAASFELDNTEYLSISDNADLSIGDVNFLFTCWVRAESLAASRRILEKADISTEYILRIKSSNQARWVVNDGTSNATVDATTFGSLTTNTWYFIAAWHDADNDEIGVQVNTSSDTQAHSTGVQDAGSSFTLGKNDASDSWDGLIDQVMFWKGANALTDLSDKLNWLYNSGAGRSYEELNPYASGELKGEQSSTWQTLYQDGAFRVYTEGG